MISLRPFSYRLGAKFLRRGRWRRWLVSYILVALAWPLAGPLPWLIRDTERHEGIEAHHSHGAGGSDEHSAEHHHDASDIPGSPTHPADHDCFQCQVLKHLSRCVLLPPDPPTLPPQPECPVQALTGALPRHTSHIVVLPPARAPPLRSA